MSANVPPVTWKHCANRVQVFSCQIIKLCIQTYLFLKTLILEDSVFFLNRQKTFQVSRFSGMGIMWMLQRQKSNPKRCWSDSFFLDICSLKKDAVLMTSNEYCDYRNNHLNQIQLLTYQICASFCLTSHLFNFSPSSKRWIQSSASCGKTKNQRERQESLTNFLHLNLWGKTSGPL